MLFVAFWIDLHTKYMGGIKDAWLHETCDMSMKKYYIVLNLHGSEERQKIAIKDSLHCSKYFTR